MKILVLSDSHAGLSFMRQCINRVKPDHVIHLGDHFDDAKAMADNRITIKMSGKAESLNASVAAAISIWEMMK